MTSSHALRGTLGAIVLVTLSAALVACGGSSSSSSGTTTTTAVASSTTVPTVAQVASTCQEASTAISAIGDAIEQNSASIDYATLDDLISSGVGPVQRCQVAMQAAVPGLPAAAQSAASTYASALGGVVTVLQNGPADAAAVPAWVAKMAAAAAPLSAAQGALAQADPDFAD
ncbi:MAG: hypothetical protein EBX39_04205 [Actinobacteria bacterium]|nr:hypothetical protein [Actinomycetota bacterium]